VKQFVLDYARYRRLGFDQLEAIDLALSRRSVVPITAGPCRARGARARGTRAVPGRPRFCTRRAARGRDRRP
jgi:hypothetical protein